MMYILYEGPSLLDGKPIVVVATQKSNNPKTGDMVQTWILRSDNDPVSANRTGEDFSICGSCPHRGKADKTKVKGMASERTCYVNIMGPNGVYKAYKNGRYSRLPLSKLRTEFLGRKVRLGSYGDPAAVPNRVWDALLMGTSGWTGYSHQPNINTKTCMVSADSLNQAREAWSRKERTFRLITDVKEVVEGKEVLCPASEEAGQLTTCQACQLCSGSTVKAKSIAIVVHGNGKKHFKSGETHDGR